MIEANEILKSDEKDAFCEQSHKTKGKRISARRGAAYVAKVAVMAALLTALKFALSYIPNVEVVTLLIIVFGSVMGIAYALPATLIFCCVEMAIYGVGSWVLLYFIYWPSLAVVSSFVLKGKRMWLALIIAVFGSVLFGVLSACCDTLICSSNLAPNMLGRYWVLYYIKGLYFDLVHTISSAVSVGLLYIPLVAALKRVANRG